MVDAFHRLDDEFYFRDFERYKIFRNLTDNLYLRFLDALLPPKNPHPPLPMINPKAYQAPLLFGANTVISSLKSINTRSTGAMIPCNNPCQNPKV